MTDRHLVVQFLTNLFRVDDDDVDDDVDEDDDFDDEDDEDEDEGDDEETETWQVSPTDPIPLKAGSGLTSGIELPRLAGICQLS
jgi:hypothetical protein